MRRQKIPGMSEDILTYHSVEDVIHSGIFDLTDERSADGCQGCIMYLSKWHLDQYSIEQVICATLFILETLYDENEDLEIHGIRVLLDFSDYTLTQQLKTQAMFLSGGRSMLMEFIQVHARVHMACGAVDRGFKHWPKSCGMVLNSQRSKMTD